MQSQHNQLEDKQKAIDPIGTACPDNWIPVTERLPEYPERCIDLEKERRDYIGRLLQQFMNSNVG